LVVLFCHSSSKLASAEATKKLEGGASPSESRIAVFEPAFREDLRFWVDCDRKVALRLMDLVESIMGDPFDGIGKPEPLKYLGANIWSHRITDEHLFGRAELRMSIVWFIGFSMIALSFYKPDFTTLEGEIG
jgi:toxin YoeB